MADTSQQQQEVPEPPQTNGVLDGLTEEEKSKMRPADIDADMREMERRKRVEMMMSSRLFREELERIIETQMKDGAGPSGLLQQISEMMGYQGARFNANVFRNSNCVVPINDIRGVESMGYAKGEKLLRCKLAAVFRLLDLYGWTQGVGGMITARLSQDHEHFLVNPYGLLYHEVTASSLVKVDMQGNIVEQGTTNFGVNIASYQLHSTIHAARPDIKCIVHIATPSVTAISATKSGLLPLGQESIVIGEVSSHHYISGANLDPEEREKLARNFGPINKVMLLTNRGALCCGETIEEAFFNVYNTVLACETQLKLMPLGVDNLTLVSDEARKAIYEASRKTPVPQQTSVAEPSPLAEKLEKRWRIGGTEFEALMRMLDNAGFRTGYIYRQPLIKSEPPRPKNDVEVPPAVSSLGYLLEEEELYKQGLWKGGRKGNDRTRWLNSPNVYQKVEILETGTPDPKKITKWVSDGSPTHSSTPVKIDGALQFVPKNTNPKEFKQLQQQIKDYRRADKISAGPQSHILEGVTWEEAKKMQDATISGTGEQVVLVGAASKGIIQRGFQHNAMVYKTPYAKNPFDAVTDQELDQYKKEIERKTKGDMYDESQSESEALSSFNISRATHESSTAKSPIQSPVSVTSETEEESRDEPKVLRIETKQVPAPSQPEVVLSDGISGVSRLSSSRSNSSVEDLCLWTGNYPICYLTTARAQELARPSKPLFTEILSASAIKREMKRDFFENYENRLKSSTFAKADNLVIVKNNQNLESGSPCSKFEECENKENLNIENLEKIKKAGARRQLRKEMETEVNEIQYSKSINMDFAEKVNLPVECIMTEMKVYNVKSEQEDNKSSSISPVELNSSKNTTKFNKNIELALKPLKKEIEEVCNTSKHSDKEYENCDNNLCDISKKESSDLNQFSENENDVFNSTESSSNSTLKVFSDNETDPKIDSIKSVSDVNDKEISQIYVNEIEFPVCNYSNGLNNSNSNLENHKVFGKCDNNNLHDNSLIIEINQSNNHIEKPSLNFNKSEEIEYDNYYNEVEFFICNNESDKTVNENNDKDPLNVSLEKRIEDNTNGQFGSNFIQKHDFDKEIIPVNNEESSNPNHSTPSRIDVVEKNPLDVSLRKFLDKENDKEDLTSNQSFSTNFLNQENDKEDLASNQSSVQNSNLWLSIDNESENFVNDNVELSSEYSASRSTELNFTYSDIEGCNEVFSPTSNKVNFFCDENLVMKRVTRRDSIADVLNSINADIRPSSKLTVDSLADTENSMKYNLDSQNMSLIYSLTPPNDIDNSSKNTTIVGDISEDDEDCKSDVNINNDEDVFWYNLPSTPDRKDSLNLNKTTELSETSFFSNISNQGSDILELPSQTYLDIQKSSDEIFHKNMSTSVNQILTELNDAEIFVSAANFVDELIEDVACLYLPRDISKYTKIELNNFIHEKIWALNFTKKLAKDLVTNLPYSANNSINSKVSNNIEEPNSIESLNESCYVIHEIIHHVVDKDSVGKWDPKNNKTITDKKAKESINVELKGLKEDYDASDEKSLKCSTPKSLTPKSKNNSLVTNHNEDHIPNIDNNDKNNEVEENVTSYSKSQQSSDTGTSMNSSPSVESQNFAEQEITSDSTDDTKSDNSKEKQSDTCETLKNPSPVENSISEMSLDSPDIPNNDENEKLIKMISEVIDNDIKSDENAELTDTCQTLNLPVFSEQLQFGILDSSKDFVNDESTKNKVNFCLIEYTKEGNVDFETEMHENFESKSDGDADSDESIKEFMQTFINNQNEIEEKIEHMWKYNEAQLEEIYATERLDQISDFKEDLAMCQEIINQLKDAQEDDITTRPYIEEQSTSFIYNNEKVKPQSQCKKIDESCTCCIDTEPLSILENMKNQCLPPISEEPELECQKIEESADASSSCNTLPPIFEELELNSSCDDIKTPEMFHSCQNSISMKSCDDQITNSTYTLSAEESECEKNYSKDVSTNDDTYKSDSIISEKIGSNNQAININVTNGIDVNKNVTGISNENLPHKDNEVVTLEYMTYSYDTKEFLQLEMACSNSSEDSNFSHCEDP